MDDQPGYMTEEIERGEDRASYIPAWGCFALAAILGLTLYGLYRLAIWLGFAWSFSL